MASSTLSKILLPLFFSIFSIVLSLLCIEALVRLTSLAAPDAVTWSDRPRIYFNPEGADSLQGFPFEREKPEDTFRIAVVGDSFTFAPFMQFTDAFPYKLEHMLNLNLGTRRAEVLNLGVPAYSTHHEVDVVRRAAVWGSDVIVLQITLNDPELKPYVPTGLQEGMPDRFGDYVVPPNRERLFRFWKTGEFIARRLHNTRTHQAYRDYFFDLYVEGSQTRREFDRSLARIARTGERRNVPVVAVIFPLFGTPLDERYPFWELHEIVQQRLDELGVPWLDLYNIYRDIPTDRLLVIPGVDRHPNEIAHRMAAEEMYLWLAREGLIPEEFLIRQAYSQRIGTTGQRRLEELPDLIASTNRRQ